jgi:hypothetical protein
MDPPRFILCKFLVVPTFVDRCYNVSKDARDPSGERWNYFSKRLFGNFTEIPASTLLGFCFLPQFYKWGDGYVYVICYECVQNMTCNKPCKKSIDVRPIDAAFVFVT